MYAGLANSGQRTGETPPAPVMLPAPLGADGGTLLAGKTAGIDWKVSGHSTHPSMLCNFVLRISHTAQGICICVCKCFAPGFPFAAFPVPA